MKVIIIGMLYMPSIQALQSLVDVKKYRPAIKETIHHVNVLTFYWSSTPVINDPQQAWHIFYKYGESYYGDKNDKYYSNSIA